MKLLARGERLSICQLPPGAANVTPSPGFFSLTRTENETSIICAAGTEPAGSRISDGWRALEVEGPLDFTLTGILASVAVPLAEAKISIFAVSTFDTDYVLVKETDLERAVTVLRSAGLQIPGA